MSAQGLDSRARCAPPPASTSDRTPLGGRLAASTWFQTCSLCMIRVMQRSPVFRRARQFAISCCSCCRRRRRAHYPRPASSFRYVDRPTRASCKLFTTTVSIQTICQQNVRNGSSLTFLNDIFVRFQMTYMSDIKLHVC